eukprot:scaffold279_cov90-Cylindrotheca_fusiformis.AAC.6
MMQKPIIFLLMGEEIWWPSMILYRGELHSIAGESVFIKTTKTFFDKAAFLLKNETTIVPTVGRHRIPTDLDAQPIFEQGCIYDVVQYYYIPIRSIGEVMKDINYDAFSESCAIIQG